MSSVDISLLHVFDEVYKARSVSEAAENLGVSQSTVSFGLAKLRKHFHDPLFVRTSAGMEPTPHAEGLIRPIRDALDLLQAALGYQVVFDPSTSARLFRIGMLDISQIVLVPTLMNHIRTIAPHVRIEGAHLSQEVPKMLESGALDLAVGFMPQLQAGFYEQTLFRQDFVCLASNDHPRIGDELTLDEFQEHGHIAVTLPGTGHWIVEKALEDQHIKRSVALYLPSFLGLGIIVENTDLLATVPRRLADTLLPRGRIKLLDPPMKLPSYKVKQHWHERYHHDPGNRWLRGMLSMLFLT